tara:strand:- start:15616 stop:16536 length:921 start_codon:yes stop_codon:yes gene_type:complete
LILTYINKLIEMETLENNKTAYKEIGQDDFISEVIEASKEKLIVVDFWAPWCGPCKDLGPRIEKIISQTDNKVNLIKINIDNNKELASQLNIQSIPTVYAFKDAKIVNAFQGSIPEKEIIKFIEKALGEKINVNQNEIISKARKLLNEEKYNESINIVEEIVATNSNNEAIEILVKSLVGLKKLEEAKNVIDSLDEELTKNENIKTAISAYNLLLNANQNESIDDLKEKVKKNPLNVEINKKLSDLYFLNKDYNDALSLMINLYVKSKKDTQKEIKKILFDYFDILGNNHEETIRARRKLSSIIFS